MVLYGLKTCDTCRKALAALENAGVDVAFRDVRSDGVPAAVMARALEAFGEKLLNTRSTTWRGLDAAERARPPLDLLADHPALMKRPLIETGGNLYLGWDKAVQDALSKKE
ncbi:MAG: ArsC/Spx/MgsR family protein [Paracoccaceae bacterium]